MRLQTGQSFAGRVGAACGRCGASFLVPFDDARTTCPACAVGHLEGADARVQDDLPEHFEPFTVQQGDLARHLGSYVAEMRFRCEGLDPARLAGRAVRLWWPLWMVDARVVGHWTARAGFDEEVETTREQLRHGRWRTEARIETRVRHEPRAGQLARRYDNAVVPAMDVHAALVERLGHLQGEAAEPCPEGGPPEGWIRLPDRTPEMAWPDAEAELQRRAALDCRDAAGADHIDEFYLRAHHDERRWTWKLVPLWFAPYTDEAGARHILVVHGRTGKVGGPRMASEAAARRWALIHGAISLALLAFTVMVSVIGIVLWFLLAVAAVSGAAALVFGGLAVWCLLWPGRWNARQVAGGTG